MQDLSLKFDTPLFCDSTMPVVCGLWYVEVHQTEVLESAKPFRYA